MANFNSTNRGVNSKMNPVKNHEGATVHMLNPLENLFGKVLGSFFAEGTYYENKESMGEFKKLIKLIEEVPENDKEYVLKVAEIGRMCNMIDYPLKVVTACANMERYKGNAFLDEHRKNKLSGYVNNIVRRADDICEILATQVAVYGFNSSTGTDGKKHRNRPIPAALKKALADKFASFDAYKLSKGLNVGSSVSLKDAMRILRPKAPNKGMEEFYEKLRNDPKSIKFAAGKSDVKSELAKRNQAPESERTNAGLEKSIMDSNLFALVKNIRAMLEKGVFDDKATLDNFVARLRDPKEIRNSKMLPFRFFSAFKMVSQKFPKRGAAAEILSALEDAVDLSIVNVEDIDGTTAIFVDLSGSMDHGISTRTNDKGESEFSSVTAMEMAALLGAIAYKKGLCDLYAFATSVEKVECSKKSTVFDIMRMTLNKQGRLGGGTDLCNALNYMANYCKTNKMKYDNIILLSDNDCYGYSNGVITYRGRFSNADAQVKEFMKSGYIGKFWIDNLLGNDFAVVNTNDYRNNLITGFSEKFVSIISVYNALGGTSDIRRVIDLYHDKLMKQSGWNKSRGPKKEMQEA